MQLFTSRNEVQIELKPKTDADKYTPSVDRMMASTADVYGNRVLGIILTGMGSDGKLGMQAIKKKGGATIAESEETSVVFGMPKEAITIGAVDKILPLYQIPNEVIRQCLS
jgi:two-component system chemotaxis response regulator CheB